jgi:hypothetical protein
MAFYPIPFGHVEVHVDRRPQRPPEHASEIARRQAAWARLASARWGR